LLAFKARVVGLCLLIGIVAAGAIMASPFYLRVGKPSASLLSLMSCGLLVSSVSGLLNNEILRQRTGWARKTSLLVHIGSAALLPPLVMPHIWAALAFKTL